MLQSVAALAPDDTVVVPFGHAKQAVPAVAFWYVPCAQDVQGCMPLEEYWPRSHSPVQVDTDVDPYDDDDVPVGQFTQDEVPAKFWYAPGAHNVHGRKPVEEYDPALQGLPHMLELALPKPRVVWPDGHGMHDVMFFPGWYVPTGHSEHGSAPVTLTEPAAQASWHTTEPDT